MTMEHTPFQSFGASSSAFMNVIPNDGYDIHGSPNSGNNFSSQFIKGNDSYNAEAYLAGQAFRDLDFFRREKAVQRQNRIAQHWQIMSSKEVQGAITFEDSHIDYGQIILGRYEDDTMRPIMRYVVNRYWVDFLRDVRMHFRASGVAPWYEETVRMKVPKGLVLANTTEELAAMGMKVYAKELRVRKRKKRKLDAEGSESDRNNNKNNRNENHVRDVGEAKRVESNPQDNSENARAKSADPKSPTATGGVIPDSLASMMKEALAAQMSEVVEVQVRVPKVMERNSYVLDVYRQGNSKKIDVYDSNGKKVRRVLFPMLHEGALLDETLLFDTECAAILPAYITYTRLRQWELMVAYKNANPEVWMVRHVPAGNQLNDEAERELEEVISDLRDNRDVFGWRIRNNAPQVVRDRQANVAYAPPLHTLAKEHHRPTWTIDMGEARRDVISAVCTAFNVPTRAVDVHSWTTGLDGVQGVYSSGGGAPRTSHVIDEERAQFSISLGSVAADQARVATEVWMDMYNEALSTVEIPLRPSMDISSVDFMHEFGALGHTEAANHMRAIFGMKKRSRAPGKRKYGGKTDSSASSSSSSRPDKEEEEEEEEGGVSKRTRGGNESDDSSVVSAKKRKRDAKQSTKSSRSEKSRSKNEYDDDDKDDDARSRQSGKSDQSTRSSSTQSSKRAKRHKKRKRSERKSSKKRPKHERRRTKNREDDKKQTESDGGEDDKKEDGRTRKKTGAS